LQKLFSELDGEQAKMRDDCLKQNSAQITDLVRPETFDKLPEKELCFFKCFYGKLGFIGETGKINGDKLQLLPELIGLEATKLETLRACVVKLDDILICSDLKNMEKCYALIM
jgi:hypothetical protein